MDNYLLMRKSKGLEDFSRKLGFERTLFLDSDFVIVESDSKKDLFKKINKIKQNRIKIIYCPRTEEMLKFALEKTAVDIVLGMEKIHPKDSVHFVRGGLDQVSCKAAKEKGKIIGFSFGSILNTKDHQKLLARMAFNIKICKKYKVKTLFSGFAMNKMEMRSRKDLEAFARILGV